MNVPGPDQIHSERLEDEFSDLTESISTPHIHCDGIGPVSIKDGMIHVIFWARQQRKDGSGFERVVVGRCTSRVENTRESLALVGSALASSMVEVIKSRIP